MERRLGGRSGEAHSANAFAHHANAWVAGVVHPSLPFDLFVEWRGITRLRHGAPSSARL